MAIQVHGFTVGPLAENAWLLADPATGSAVLVDPGDEPQRLLKAVAEAGCELESIWLTHAHFDHVGAVAGILEQQPVPVYLHPLDVPLYRSAERSAALWGVALDQPPDGTVDLAEGTTMSIGETEFLVWHVPGHAPGHVAFIGAGLCISGDVLFAGSIGRTDLPFCDPSAMHQSLQRLATLPPSTRVLCGHGEDTSIGEELLRNPFLRGLARPVGA